MAWYQFDHKKDPNAPSARECHSLAVLGKQLCTFGGNDQANRMNDIHILDTETMKWTKFTAEPPAEVPAKRSAHSACLVDGKFLYVFGGWDGMTELGDLCRFDIETKQWKRLNTVGTPPCPRHFHNAVAVGRYMYVFGGYDGTRWRNDAVSLNLDTLHWEEVKPDDDVKPGPRASGAATLVGTDKMLVFGGYDGDDFLDDVWVLHTADETGARRHRWERIQKPPERDGHAPYWPQARSGHSVESCGPLLFFVGGRFRQGRFNDVVVLDADTMEWMQFPVSGEPFKARKTHAVGRVGTKLFLFGGHDGEQWMGDVHILDLTTFLRASLPRLTVTVPPSTLLADMSKLLGIEAPRTLNPRSMRDARKCYVFGLTRDRDALPFDLRHTNPHNRLYRRRRVLAVDAPDSSLVMTIGNGGVTVASPQPAAAPRPMMLEDDDEEYDDEADGAAQADLATSFAPTAYPLSSYASFLGGAPTGSGTRASPMTLTPSITQPLAGMRLETDPRRGNMSGSPNNTAEPSGSVAHAAIIAAGEAGSDVHARPGRHVRGAARMVSAGEHSEAHDASDGITSPVADAAITASPAQVPGGSRVAGGAMEDMPRPAASRAMHEMAPDRPTYVDNTLFADITFVVDGEEVHLHKAILAARCDYFRGMFSRHFSESDSARIVLPDVDLAVFKAIIRYIYFDALPDEDQLDSLVLPLLQQAQKMGLHRLSRQCQRYLEAAMAIDNAAAMLQSADTYGADMLRAACFKYILDNFPTASTTYGFINLRQDLMREILHRRAERERGAPLGPPMAAVPRSTPSAAAAEATAAPAASTTPRQEFGRIDRVRRASRSLDQALHSAQTAQLESPFVTLPASLAGLPSAMAAHALRAGANAVAARAGHQALAYAAPQVPASAGKRRRPETAELPGPPDIPRMASGGWDVRAMVEMFEAGSQAATPAPADRPNAEPASAASSTSTLAEAGVEDAGDGDAYSYENLSEDEDESAGVESSRRRSRFRGASGARARRGAAVKRSRAADAVDESAV